MIELRISAAELRTLRSTLLGGDTEQCAVLLAARAHRASGSDLMLVRETILPGQEDYTASGVHHAELRPEFVALVAKRARSEDLSLVFVHTHPGLQPPDFSPVDDQGEAELSAFLSRREMNGPHAALVISQGGLCARMLGQSNQIRVVAIGDTRIVEFDPGLESENEISSYDRQIRAFGAEGQRILHSLRIAVVGLGGTGSIASEQLVHLGIRDFLLIDPDHIETTNLNRVVGANANDVGLDKVEVVSRYLQRHGSTVNIQSIVGDIVHSSVAQRLVEADVIFCCTDSHGSRSVIQQVAYQYLIPCIDIGSTISISDGRVTLSLVLRATELRRSAPGYDE
jgi:proteasome lid subunit RPN8/RPN11